MYTRKPTEIGDWASGAEIQTSAVDTRTGVWVSTAENFFKIVLGEARHFSPKLGVVSALSGTKLTPQTRSDHGGRKRLATFPLQKSQGFLHHWPQKNRSR